MVGIPNHRRGPSRNQLLCLKLNFAAVKAPYLTPTQLDAMELQFKIAVKDTYEVIHGSARAAAALAPAEAAAASGPPPPVSWAAGALKLPAARPAAAAQAAASSEPWEREIESFGELLLSDLVCALSRDHSVFCPLTFWAAPSIIAKLPTLAALARGEFSGFGAEATSERTFSYSGRVFSKLRRSMSMENLAAMVIGAAYPGVLTNNQIMDKYLSKLAAD
jgi:hypothetical protein